jgi:hypothetical protein
MKILKDCPKIIHSVTIEDKNKDVFRRVEYQGGVINWEALTFDGEFEDEDLEKEYQKLIKSKQLNSWKKIFKESQKHQRSDEMYWVDDVFEWLEKTFEVPKLKK